MKHTAQSETTLILNLVHSKTWRKCKFTYNFEIKHLECGLKAEDNITSTLRRNAQSLKQSTNIEVKVETNDHR